MNISVNLDVLKSDERETLLRLIGKANKPMKEEFVCIKQRRDKVTWEQLLKREKRKNSSVAKEVSL